MTAADRIPVIVGVGETRGPGAAASAEATPREPRELIAAAIRVAQDDAAAGAPWLHTLDSIAVCNVASWAYDDLPGLLATELGASPTDRFASPIGGQWPTRLLDRAAEMVADGAIRTALVAGGETQSSVTTMGKEGRDPSEAAGWTRSPGGPPEFDLDQLGSAAMQAAGLLVPVRVYPLFENRLRFELGQSVEQAGAWAADIYAAFSDVAAANPIAWKPVARTSAEIGTVAPGNRMVCEPYSLAMNAMPHVDQAAAVLVTSLAHARELGIAEDRIVHVWGGAGASDTDDVLERETFGGSWAMRTAMSRALEVTGLDATSLDVVDVYSPFPVVPKLAMLHLGLPHDSVLTVTGGHSAFGGPLSSYSVHALAAATRALRNGARTALVHANGGYMTHQHSIVLGAEPHEQGYVGSSEPSLSQVAPTAVGPVADGRVTVETVTVEHSREGGPGQAFLVARDADGRRVAGQTRPGDLVSARALSVLVPTPREVIGTDLQVAVEDGHVRVLAG
jgi:acetyl-CoA C-acetyltransferase